MNFYNENNYSSSDDDEENEELTEIQNEKEYDKKIKIIQEFKDFIILEPEFIGIKNISSYKILNIIENTYYPFYNIKNNINNEQLRYFKRLYDDLLITDYNNEIIYSVIYEIFKNIYV
jgi:hypothetical protein